MAGDGKRIPEAYVLRTHRPGDMSFIASRHGAIYAGEYGWSPSFEAAAARLAADFIDNLDKDRERCWIAEANETFQFLGCVAIVKNENKIDTARLRMLLVETEARGIGLGAALIDECVAFARAKGYVRIILWTYSILEGARRLYKRAGFQMVKAFEEKESWGQPLVEEVWELVL